MKTKLLKLKQFEVKLVTQLYKISQLLQPATTLSFYPELGMMINLIPVPLSSNRLLSMQ